MTTGSYSHIDGQPLVRFERTFPHPVQAVWEAITDPAQLEEWFPTTVEFAALSPGAPVEFRFPEGRFPPMTGEILDVRRERLLAFTWGEDRLSFELAPADEGAACRLVFSVVLDTADKAARDSAGWDSCLDMLQLVAGGGAPQRPAGTANWEAYYEEYKRQGLPATAEIPS
jgi:uncharacterized protein YndB with AHSA1/START domain